MKHDSKFGWDEHFEKPFIIVFFRDNQPVEKFNGEVQLVAVLVLDEPDLDQTERFHHIDPFHGFFNSS
jgi:hypothetical protein